ncbi:AfsR/SARP family transcriptional regulator [Streptomyces montanisoli]|uniref:AfsR/SARP family transcriptional regulator n=1 Tax=Streptomyces montanisoli TaxID=2798581 RepID=A0A940M6Y4_9ACTN|nr:BTAD domain-containing putative transcriptional regulator [Streptomyces montanisoli]MBP0457305.1 AfsR/SARP family transcriptional regulator [Streptomyces montanisoli]
MGVSIGVLGPVLAWDGEGGQVALKGPRHRAVLARLVVARRRVVPVTRLVEDLWDEPPPDAVGAVRTFVAVLRRAVEPERPPRATPRLLVTEGPGYALRPERDAVDAWRFEHAVTAAAGLAPAQAAERLDRAIGWWRGPAYADFAGDPWARTERARLAELRLRAVEARAQALLALGRAAEAAAGLDAHVAEHPWRENAWGLLARALYRDGRQGDALAVLRRARALLAGRLGVEPGPALRRLEEDILAQAGHLGPGGGAEEVWARAAAAYDRTVAVGARARLESTVGLLRDLAVTGGPGLLAAREHRVAAALAAEETGDAELTARVIGAYDVPAVWTRVDDPAQAARVVAAAERTLAALPDDGHDSARARLLATIAVETRGTPPTPEGAPPSRGRTAALRAERLARGLDDPALLAFALDGLFMQTCHRTGLATERDAIGAELVGLATRHGLVTYEVLGHLIRCQARSALADFSAADRHADAATALARRNELPLVDVFTRWYRAMRLAASGTAPAAEAAAAYRYAAAALDGAGMPGLERGLLPLALLSLRVRDGQPADAGEASGTDWGPYRPWALPLVLLAGHREEAARAALRALPDPPGDLLTEAMWCLAARAAVTLGDTEVLARARAALAPAAGELAGAGSGLLALGPVTAYLDEIDAALDVPSGR